jgi:hypothetical protein
VKDGGEIIIEKTGDIGEIWVGYESVNQNEAHTDRSRKIDS